MHRKRITLHPMERDLGFLGPVSDMKELNKLIWENEDYDDREYPLKVLVHPGSYDCSISIPHECSVGGRICISNVHFIGVHPIDRKRYGYDDSRDTKFWVNQYDNLGTVTFRNVELSVDYGPEVQLNDVLTLIDCEITSGFPPLRIDAGAGLNMTGCTLVPGQDSLRPLQSEAISISPFATEAIIRKNTFCDVERCIQFEQQRNTDFANKRLVDVQTLIIIQDNVFKDIAKQPLIDTKTDVESQETTRVSVKDREQCFVKGNVCTKGPWGEMNKYDPNTIYEVDVFAEADDFDLELYLNSI